MATSELCANERDVRCRQTPDLLNLTIPHRSRRHSERARVPSATHRIDPFLCSRTAIMSPCRAAAINSRNEVPGLGRACHWRRRSPRRTVFKTFDVMDCSWRSTGEVRAPQRFSESTHTHSFDACPVGARDVLEPEFAPT